MDHVQDANDAAAKQNDEAVDESLDVLASYRLAGKASARAGQEQSSEHAPASTAAFFDVDNTIMRGASIYHFARGLARRKYFTFGQITGFAYKQLKFVTSGSEDLEDVASITAAALSFVEGRDVEELAALGEEIFDEITDRLIPGTLALAQQHLDSGHEVWLVTATPVELASILARRLGLTGALGTVSEIKDGNYTGRLVGKPLHGLAKAEAVRALAEREGLDLTQCWAYSDSANDIPMLSAVGHPVVVNADATLRAHARAQGWRVRDFTRREAIKKAALPTLAGAAGVMAGIAVGYVAGRSRQTPSI